MSDPLDGGERRTLTVLVCDLAESTTLSSRLDPEDFAEILERLGALWREAVEGVDGRILKWTGDGFIGVFGYPRAHENAPIRAVAAALDLVAASDLERESGRLTPDLRVGVHTGLTLIQHTGEGPDAFDIVGDTPAIATRLESIAPRNAVLVSAATAQRLGLEFELEPVGDQALKGIQEPVEVFRVLRRSDAVLRTGAETLVGRDGELTTLLECWQRAVDGTPGGVLVCAPPGIGKTRLIEELIGRAREKGRTYVLRCSELMQTTSLFPVVRGLRGLVGWSPDATTDELRGRLDAEFGALGVPSAPDLVAGLLGIDPRDPGSLPVEPAMRRAQLLAALAGWVEHQASLGPVCFVVEDLHWADASTIELLSTLAARDGDLSLLLVLSTRPQGLERLSSLAGLARIDLGPLAKDDARRLIEEIVGGPVPEALGAELLARSDAVPLYLEELTRAVSRAGLLSRGEHGFEARGHLADTDIPLSLADTLMMRLDGLGPARAAASAAATIGRTFEAGLLSSVTSRPQTLEADLDAMCDAGVLTRSDAPGGRVDYTFSHALLRDAAYASLTRRARRDLHGRIATAIVEVGDRSEPAVLAHHYTEAGQTLAAVETWGEAGRTAFAVAAYDESIANYRRGLALVEDLGADDAWRLELPLQLGVGGSYATRLGYMSEEAEAAYLRASDLSAHAGDVDAFPALLGLWQYYQVRSDRERRRALGERCNELAQLSSDAAVRLEGMSALSTTLAFEGEIASALAIMDEGIALFEAEGRREMEFASPQHPVAGFYAISGPLLWSMGRFREAEARYVALQYYAEHPVGVRGPFTSGYAHAFSAWFCLLRADYEAAAAHANRAMEIGMTHGILVWIGGAYPLLGIATALKGDAGAGAQMTSDGIAAWRGAGSGLMVSYFEHGLALCQEAGDDVEAALSAADAGIEHAATHAERFHLAELHRVRGRLLERLEHGDDAAAARRDAAATARAQGAACFEARALIDLVGSGAAAPAERDRLLELRGALIDEDDGSEEVRSILAAALALAGSGEGTAT